MSQPNQHRLWLLVGFVALLSFTLMFMGGSDKSVDEDRYAEEFEEFENSKYVTAREVTPGDILVLVVTVGAVLLTFHPVYGGLNPRYRLYYQFALVFLSGLAVSSFLAFFPVSEAWMLPNTLFILFPFLVILYIMMFPLLLGSKRYQLTHRILDLGQRIAPKNANLFLSRAWVYQAQGNFEKSLESVDRALEVTPRLKKKEEAGWFAFEDWRLINGHAMRMNIYFSLAQYDLALEDTEFLVRLRPSDPKSYMNRSMALRKRGEFAAAAAELDTAAQMTLNPYEQSYLLYSRAHLAAVQNQDQEALDLYQAALEVPMSEPQQKAWLPEVHAQIGMVEMRRGHDEAAEQAFHAMKALEPEFYTLGFVGLQAKHGHWDEAMTEWQKLIARVPHFNNVEFLRRLIPDHPTLVELLEQVIARQEQKAA